VDEGIFIDAPWNFFLIGKRHKNENPIVFFSGEIRIKEACKELARSHDS